MSFNVDLEDEPVVDLCDAADAAVEYASPRADDRPERPPSPVEAPVAPVPRPLVCTHAPQAQGSCSRRLCRLPPPPGREADYDRYVNREKEEAPDAPSLQTLLDPNLRESQIPIDLEESQDAAPAVPPVSQMQLSLTVSPTGEYKAAPVDRGRDAAHAIALDDEPEEASVIARQIASPVQPPAAAAAAAAAATAAAAAVEGEHVQPEPAAPVAGTQTAGTQFLLGTPLSEMPMGPPAQARALVSIPPTPPMDVLRGGSRVAMESGDLPRRVPSQGASPPRLGAPHEDEGSPLVAVLRPPADANAAAVPDEEPAPASSKAQPAAEPVRHQWSVDKATEDDEGVEPVANDAMQRVSSPFIAFVLLHLTVAAGAALGCKTPAAPTAHVRAGRGAP
jgi:hypothetical protein